MVWQFVAAGVLGALGAAWHGIGGEREVMPPLRDASLAPALQTLIRIGWHLSTVTFLVTGGWLLATGLNVLPERSGAHVIALLYSAYGVLAFLVAVRRGLGGALRAPQWALLLGIAALTYWGTA